MDARKYLPTVAWRTNIANVILVSSETINDAAVYRVTVSPVDYNEISELSLSNVLLAGYYLKDYVGHTYTIISVGSGTIDITDDFRIGLGPQSGRFGIIYKSVGKGRSPYLAPIYYRHLDRSALEYSRQYELDILWKNDPNPYKISFANTNIPKIENYQQTRLDGYNFAEDFGETPKIQLFTLDSAGVYWERQEKPIWNHVDGLLDSIVFDLSDYFTGYIIISR